MAACTEVNDVKDVQSEKDLRNIPLKHVGIKGLRWPIELRDKARGTQHSVAEVTLAVDLPHDMRGTHMSRFVECLRTLGPVGLADVEAILDQLKQHLQAERAFIELKFPYFVTKKAPVSGMEAPMDIDCVYKAEKGEKLRWRITAVVPVQTLCPCSKEISRYGAHNQRSRLTASVELSAPMSLEEQIAYSEEAASCQLWARLKRSDEKYVTEYAYDHPKFVEDIVRDMAAALNKEERVVAYRVEAENFESIHNHSAYAYITHDKR